MKVDNKVDKHLDRSITIISVFLFVFIFILLLFAHNYTKSYHPIEKTIAYTININIFNAHSNVSFYTVKNQQTAFNIQSFISILFQGGGITINQIACILSVLDYSVSGNDLFLNSSYINCQRFFNGNAVRLSNLQHLKVNPFGNVTNPANITLYINGSTVKDVKIHNEELSNFTAIISNSSDYIGLSISNDSGPGSVIVPLRRGKAVFTGVLPGNTIYKVTAFSNASGISNVTHFETEADASKTDSCTVVLYLNGQTTNSSILYGTASNYTAAFTATTSGGGACLRHNLLSLRKRGKS